MVDIMYDISKINYMESKYKKATKFFLKVSSLWWF